jgi:DNA repair protein RecN (Recombination protein N)
MLERLAVANLVVIRDAELEFAPGLNVITGETGAGKTILTQALDLVLGGRADASLVGPATSDAYVEAVFSISPAVLEREAFDGVRDLVDEPDDGLVLARRVATDGRSRALVCGRSATRTALSDAGSELVSVVSQHEARALTRPAVQRRLLDAFLGQEHHERLEQMQAAWRGVGDARRDLADAERASADTQQRADELDHLARRVEQLAPSDDEQATLREERDRLRHADQLAAAAAGAAELVNPDDGDGALLLAARAVRSLQGVEEYDPALRPIAEDLRSAHSHLEEAAHGLARYAAGIEHDPARLDAVEQRLGRLDELAHQYGSLAAAISEAAEARGRLDELAEHGQRVAALRTALDDTQSRAERVAAAVSAARHAAAGALADRVERHLNDLGMADARVEVAVTRRELGPTGSDDVAVRVAPNPGVSAGSVADTASGGELSRITLAIRLAAQEHAGVPILVFDEIDAGVGGRTALAVADKLGELAAGAQIICITHLAQIAARGDRHFRVVKQPGDPTVTRIEQLADADVDRELARMLGGVEGQRDALRLARALRTGREA